MKTTVQLDDVLAEQVRELALREGKTFESVLIEALQLLIRNRMDHSFTLEDCSIGVGGLRREWQRGGLREVIDDARTLEL